MNWDRKIKSGPTLADESDNVALNWSQNSRQTYQVKRQIERKQERQTEGKGEMCQLPEGLRQKT